jgi:protease-4
MTFEQVDAIGQGKVWVGSEAGEKWFSRQNWGLDAAIKEAALLGKQNIPQNYPEYRKDYMNDLLAGFPFAQSKAFYKRNRLENYKLLQGVKRLQMQRGTNRTSFQINIR